MNIAATASGRRPCPSCATSFTPDRSNQRFCRIECRQYATNVRRGLSAKAEPEVFRKRLAINRLKAPRGVPKLCSVGSEAPQDASSHGLDRCTTKLCNANGKPIEAMASEGPFRTPRVPGWSGYDDKRCLVFMPYQLKALTRLECIAIKVRYPAKDGVYRVA